MGAFSGEEKLDLLFKKVAGGVTKTGRSDTTGLDGESISSFTAVAPTHVWKEATASNITSTPPGSNTAYVGVYEVGGSGSVGTTGQVVAPVTCSAVGSSAHMPGFTNFKRAWDTGLENWIGPAFGSNYKVRVYVGASGWDGTEGGKTTSSIVEVEFGQNPNADWNFDYEAGTLYWTNEEDTGETSSFEDSVNFVNTGSVIANGDIVYVTGYRYIGQTGVGGTITGGASTIASADLTVNRALISNGDGKVAVSDVTDTELGYLDGVTSGIQAQINGKQATITGGATTIVSDDLGVSLALVSDSSGKVAVSDVTSTELGYLDGVTSGIQAQIDTKQATITGGATTIVSDDLGVSLALVSDSSGKVAVSAVTATELGYLDGVTSGIQAQIDTKQATITGGATTIVSDDLGVSLALVSDSSGKVAVSAVTATELGYLDGVTSGIQAQINAKQATITGGATTIVSDDLGVSLALVSDSSGKVAVSAVTATELGYLDGVTSGIQAQINAKQATITGGATTIVSDDLTASRALVSDTSGKVGVSDVTSTELGYLDGVTSAIQGQIDGKVTANSAIAGATKTKITFDAKGLVTGGADLVAGDIPDLSGTYLTSESFTSVTVNGAASTTTYNVALLAQGDTATATDVYIESADFTFTHSSSAGRGKLSTGDLLVKGDLTVLGTGSVINLQQENVYMRDAIITLGNADDATDTDYTDAAELAVDIGIEAYKKGYVTDDTTKYPKVVFDHSASVWAVNNWSHAASAENKIAEKFVSAAYAWTDTDETNGYAEITHNLNTQRILVQVTNDSDEVVFVKFIANTVHKARIFIAGAVETDEFDIVIIG